MRLLLAALLYQRGERLFLVGTYDLPNGERIFVLSINSSMTTALIMRLPEAKQERMNYFHLIGEIFWFGLAFSATNRFLPVFALRLDASPFEVGLLTALPGLFLLIGTALSGWWRTHFKTTMKALYLPSFLFRLVFILPFFAPLLPQPLQVPWLIASAVLPSIPQGIAGALFVVMMRESMNDGRLPNLWSRRLVSLNVALAGSTLVYGYLLEWLAFPLGYQVMFLFSFLFALISFLQVMQTRALYFADHTRQEENAAPNAPVTRRLSYKQMWRTPECWSIVFVVFVTHLAFFSVQPMIQVHMVNNLHATEEFIAWFGLVELLAAATAGLFADKIMVKIGARQLIAATIGATGISVSIVALAPSLNLTLLHAAISGAAWTTASVAFFGFLMERTPAQNMQGMTMIFNQIVGLGQFAGSMFGSTLSSTTMHLAAILGIGAALRLGSAALTLDTYRIPQFFKARLKRRVVLAPQLGGD
jgi:MFS family permease